MNKAQFLGEIKRRLRHLSEDDIKPSLDYYEEMIDDYIENGMSPEEAVAEMGTVDEAVAHILSEMSGEELKDRRPLCAREIVILVFASPFILIFASVALTLIISVWAVILSLYAADLSFAVAAIAGAVVGGASVIAGKALEAVASFGTALVFLGLSILLFLALYKLTVLFAKFNKFIFKKTGLLFTRRRKN